MKNLGHCHKDDSNQCDGNKSGNKGRMVLGPLHGCLDLKVIITIHGVSGNAVRDSKACPDKDVEQETAEEDLIEATEEGDETVFIALIGSHLGYIESYSAGVLSPLGMVRLVWLDISTHSHYKAL